MASRFPLIWPILCTAILSSVVNAVLLCDEGRLELARAAVPTPRWIRIAGHNPTREPNGFWNSEMFGAGYAVGRPLSEAYFHVYDSNGNLRYTGDFEGDWGEAFDEPRAGKAPTLFRPGSPFPKSDAFTVVYEARMGRPQDSDGGYTIIRVGENASEDQMRRVLNDYPDAIVFRRRFEPVESKTLEAFYRSAGAHKRLLAERIEDVKKAQATMRGPTDKVALKQQLEFFQSQLDEVNRFLRIEVPPNAKPDLLVPSDRATKHSFVVPSSTDYFSKERFAFCVACKPPRMATIRRLEGARNHSYSIEFLGSGSTSDVRPAGLTISERDMSGRLSVFLIAP